MTFEELQNSIRNLSSMPGLDFFTAGFSMLGKPIYGVHLGNYTGTQILIEGAMHAREWVTAPLIVEQVKYLYGKNIDGGIFFIPMTNPDGVELVLDGPDNIRCEKLKEYLISVNEGSRDFSLWKANANTVDENVNFDARWGGGVQNVFCPASANFVGYYPNSEREVRDIIDFSLKNSPRLTISYHTKGEIIYYGFEGLSEQDLERDYRIGTILSEVTGYPLVQSVGSTGGYQDWVSEHLKVPAYTIEVGNAEIPHPIGIEQLPVIFEQNKKVPLVALAEANRLLRSK